MGFQDFYLIFAFVIVVGIIVQRAPACDPNDLSALQSFMAVFQNPPDDWQILNSSDSKSCCKWEGVTCDEEGRVVKLELPKKRLSGKLSESLGSLDQLKTLNLSNNFLKSSLPVSIFNLSKLQVLDLSFNEFYGPVPDFSDLSSIQILDMSQNNLNGLLPGRVCEGGSTELKVLNLAVNHFSGEVPSGFSDCGLLNYLNLRMNDLSAISEDLFRLQNLSTLIIAYNGFSCPLSQGIGNLSNLVRLDISTNLFSGTIPNVFNKLGKLQSFVAHSNNFVGNIPDSLSNSPILNLLILRNNSLEGSINLNCSAMANLTSLDLGTNRFSGNIPNNIPSCRHLNNVNLARNNFIGEIPESFKDFQSLTRFSISNTKTTNLSSALRILQHCKSLTTLVMTINFLDDAFPADSDLEFRQLQILIIASCRLTGSVPQWLMKSKSLFLLDLSWNRLAGTVPRWLGDFELLFYLDLSNNSFVGEIPISLTQLPSLIDTVHISIQEPLPLDSPFIIRRNQSDRGLRFNHLWSSPPTLDLSYNNLSGLIWLEFGNLRNLHVLNLKFNELSGSIPSNLSGMRSLESLDLSHNDLSGTIPSSLERLSFLWAFSVAYNNLHGLIPTGGQFQTFPNSSFEGNDLCSKMCDDDQFQQSETNNELATNERDYVLLMTTGVGVALGLVFGATLFEVASRKSLLFMKLLLRLNIHT